MHRGRGQSVLGRSGKVHVGKEQGPSALLGRQQIQTPPN